MVRPVRVGPAPGPARRRAGARGRLGEIPPAGRPDPSYAVASRPEPTGEHDRRPRPDVRADAGLDRRTSAL